MTRAAAGVLCAVAVLLFPAPIPLPAGNPTAVSAAAWAGEPWKAEFEAICSKTDVATTLSTGELKDLIARCDTLERVIGAEGEPGRKVYLRRLRMCRELYGYMLEHKERNR